MSLKTLSRRSFLAAAALCSAAAVTASTAQQPKFPESLDVPYVPTSQPTVEAMLRIANVRPGDFVVDLGSGDGRIPITAAKKYGARGLGVDLDPARIRESMENAKAAGVADRVEFQLRNLFDAPIREATVVTMYLLPSVNFQLRPRLLKELKPGTRVVSHEFDMADWKADIRASVRGYGSQIHFWVVPARAAGRWEVRVAAPPEAGERYELEITQQFQEIEVHARRGGAAAYVREARLEGEEISFLVIEDAARKQMRRFTGKVSGPAMEGTVRGEGAAPRGPYPWRATRAAP